MRESRLTAGELLQLPAAIDLVTAGRAFGLGRTKAHELARAGEFPVRVLRLGREYRVATADVLALLGIDRDSGGERHSRASGADVQPRSRAG